MASKSLELFLSYTQSDISFGSPLDVNVPANSFYLYATLDDGVSSSTIYASAVAFRAGIFNGSVSSDEYVLNFQLDDTFAFVSSFQPLLSGVNFNFNIDSHFYMGLPSVGGSSIDLTPVLNGINSLQSQINSLSSPTVDLTPVLTKLDNLNYPDIDINAFNFYSLNGNCGSLPDGTIVTVTGLEGDFEVSSSQFAWNDSTAQNSMIMYKLSKNGAFCLAPDVYVSRKV